MASGYTYHLNQDVIVVRYSAVIQYFKDESDRFLSNAVPEAISDIVQSYYEDHENIQSLNEALEQRYPPCGQTKYAFFKIISPENESAVLHYSTNSPCKIWVNGKLVSVSANSASKTVVCQLKRGENLVVTQKLTTDTNGNLSFRFSRYTYEMQNSPLSLLDENCGLVDDLDILLGSQFLLDQKSFSFLMLKNRDILNQVEPSFHLTALGIDVCEEIGEYPFQYGQKTTWDFSKAVLPQGTVLIQCELKNKKKESVCSFVLAIENTDRLTQQMGDITEQKIQSETFSEDEKLELEYIQNRYAERDFSDRYALTLLSRFLQILNHNTQVSSSRNFKRYYRSILDTRPEKLDITLPSGYNEQKKYPLYLTFATGRYTANPKIFQHYGKNDVVFADVSGRGYTMGSYVGDAAIKEAIQFILDHYSIDRDRIYASGNSNGGGAVWIQAQLSPDFFAGIAPIAGLPNTKLMQNLHSIKIINTSSESDEMYASVFQAVKPKKQFLSDYTGLLYPKMNHQQLPAIRGKCFYVDELLKAKRDLFPSQIRFKTFYHRCKKCYWMELHGIVFGKKEATMKADIAENGIDIRVTNAIGFTVTLPPQIDRNQFFITVNGTRHLFSSYEKEHIVFRRTKQGYLCAEAPISAPCYKGTGLIDVYLKPLRIVTANSEDSAIVSCAKQLANPGTMGHGSVIHIHYPIFAANALPVDIFSCAQILIDTNSNDTYMKSIRSQCIIRTDSTGWSYGNQNFSGSYCVMQILENPNNPDTSILYINCNDTSMLKKNIFTRRIILPSYYNGLHPYLNNEALIFCDGTYYSVFEKGSPLLPIGRST